MHETGGCPMVRLGRILLLLGLFACAAAVGALLPGETAPAASPGMPAGQRAVVMPAAAKKSSAENTRARQCKALNKCRWNYAQCEKKVYGGMKPGPKRDAAKEACVDTYRACIKKGFPNGGMMFERWFMPGACT